MILKSFCEKKCGFIINTSVMKFVQCAKAKKDRKKSTYNAVYTIAFQCRLVRPLSLAVTSLLLPVT